jgi:large subunit ribosomal protein L6
VFIQNLLNMKYKNSINLNDISLFRYNDYIVFLSSKGRVVLNRSKDNYESCYQISPNSITINNRSSVQCKVESIINGLREFYTKKLNLVGIGFRAWCYFDKIKNCQSLCVKVGLSKDVLIFIPQDVIVVCLKPTLILVKGFDKYSVSLTAHKIKSVKKPDAYKGKGIRYENEVIHIKPGKQK